MIEQLLSVAVPQWVLDLTPKTMEDGQFPLQELLRDSLYYPASGFDGDPIEHLGGNIISFVYVDYAYTRERLRSELEDPGFHGYDLLATRVVTERELAPRGWHPESPISDDGDPSRYRDWIQEPFCDWCVFQRQRDFPDSHRPDRFSLLYLCADGVTAFQVLYVTNSVAPKAVAIIQPGTRFGGNWTDFRDPEKIFARSVLGNPGGRPEILLYGGIGARDGYHESCWPDYSNFLGFVDGSIGVFSRRPD